MKEALKLLDLLLCLFGTARMHRLDLVYIGSVHPTTDVFDNLHLRFLEAALL